MNYITDYQPTHYSFFIKKCEKIINGCNDVDCWVKQLSIDENIIWIKTIKNLKKNEPDYNIESSTLITLTILLFMLELEVEDEKIQLSNGEIKKIIHRFEKILRKEYGYKKNIINRKKYVHTLLQDV
jgi:hypothetical protein